MSTVRKFLVMNDQAKIVDCKLEELLGKTAQK